MTGRPMPTRGALRVCRGVMLAGTSTTLAVAAHAVAGGGLPDTGLMVVLTAGVAAAGMALADRRLSGWSILTVLGTAQLVMHVLLSSNMTSMSGMVSGLPHQGATMLLAHAVAVVVTAAVLFHADGAMFFVSSVIARLVPVIVVAPRLAPSAPPRLRPARAPVVRPAAVLLCRANARRGPPAVA